MSFFNYFTDKERGGAQRAIEIKNRAFAAICPWLVRLHVPPDAISYLGIAYLVGVVIWFMHHPFRALLLLVLYVINDGLDGSYARHLNRPTQAGAFTDIVADQLGMVVIALGFIQYRMVDGMIGAYYITAYIVMIVFSVVQNAQKIPMQYIFRSKYILYGIYALWAISGVNLAPYLIPVFCLVMTVSGVQSFLRLKRGFFFKYDMPKIFASDQKLRDEGKTPPKFWRWLNVAIPTAAVAFFMLAGAYTQIVSMLERAEVRPEWQKSVRLPLQDKNERPRAIAAYRDGWLVLAHDKRDGFDRVYYLDGADLQLQGFFKVPWALHRDHGASADGDFLYIADRQSRRVFEVNVPDSLARESAILTRSFDSTLHAPVGCAALELGGEKLLLISEYMQHYKTILVDREKALSEGTAARAIKGWYRNGGFSRGISAREGLAFEMNSSLWKDLIYVVDLDRVRQSKYIRTGIVRRIASPRWHCRDLALSGRTIAVVDGKSPWLHTAELPPFLVWRTEGAAGAGLEP